MTQFLAVLIVIFVTGFPVFLGAASELVFWNFWDQKLVKPIIARFEKQHPGVRIRSEQLNWNNGFDKLVMAIAGGRGPDICELGSTWTGRFMAAGAVLDITESVQDLENEYLLRDATIWKGRVYGLPWLVSTRVLFYNRTLFQRAGLDPDNPPRTWPTLIEAAKRLHQPAQGLYGIGINSGEGHVLYKKFLPFVWTLDGEILGQNGDWAFDNPATRETLALYNELLPFGFREKQDFLDEAFLNGRLGLEISGSWLLARQKKEAPNLDLGVALIPPPSDTRGHTSSFLGGQVLVLLKSCRNSKLAVEFIRFLTLPENTLPITRETMVSFPAHRQAYQDPFFQEPHLSVFVKQLKTAVHPPVHPLWIDCEAIINDTLERALFGQDYNLLLERAARRFEQIRSRYQLRWDPSPSSLQISSKDAWPSVPPTTAFNTVSTHFRIVIFFASGAALLLALLSGMIPGTQAGRARTNLWGQQKNRTIWFILPWLLTFSVFWLYPILFSLVLSCCDYDIFNPDNLRFIGLAHFSRLIEDRFFLQAFGNTLYFAVSTTLITTLLGFVLAFLLNRQRLGETILRSVFFLPSIISVVVVATIFKALYSPLGPANMALAGFGILPRGWLTDPLLALNSVVAMDIWAATGFSVVLFLAAFKAIPRQLYEAAQVDGAGEWVCFRHITLPQMRPMLLFVLIINTVRSWQVFPEVFALTRGGPLGTTNTIVHHLYETAFRFHDLGYASAMAYALTAVLLVLSWLKMQVLKEREA